jgi:hypothetical protein
MQKISFYIAAFFFAGILLMSSCQKKLDVTSPQDVSTGEVFSSDENVKRALNGAYNAVSNGYVLGGDMQLYSELLAANGEIRWTGTYEEPGEIYTKRILVTNAYVASTYDDAYSAINICNNILAAINVVNDADRDRVKGEALFLRGLMYFELVELYAKPYSDGNATTNPGLQLITAPTTGTITDSNYVARSSVQQTYDFILSDLTQAETLLKSIKDDDNGVYANRFAAAAVLSRVYLQMEDYAKARDEANLVITGGDYALVKNFADEFNNSSNTTEDIFAIQVNEQDGANDMQLFWSITDYGARDGDVDVLQKEIDEFEDADARKALYYVDESDVYRSGKWKYQYKNLPILRLAEMYLTRAECNFRLGTKTGAEPLEDIKTIRSRVDLTTDPSYITLANILLERKRELEDEGQDIQDRKRLKEPVVENNNGQSNYPYDAYQLILPIPQREIDASNGALTQTEGY